MAVNERKPDVRAAVLSSLIRTENGSKFSNLELDSALSKYNFDRKDKALFTALYYGVIERKITLDTVIGRLSSRSLDKIDSRALMILRIALYQLMFMDRIPAHAAVSSAVDLTRKGGTDSFVNALLRSYLRNPDAFKPENMKLSGTALLRYKYSLPDWMIESFIADSGRATAEKICEAANSRPPVTLRINNLRADRDSVISELKSNEVETEPSKKCESALYLVSHHPTEMITAIKSGRAFVQDESSQLTCEILAPEPGERVMDICACPGGKSFSSAIMMENKGEILAFDLRLSKLNLVKNGAEALGISIIGIAEQDGRSPLPEYFDSADRVLCDVPCSGLGVLAKKPDIREKSESDVERLPEVQLAILKNAANYVKVGGTLVYSTCTLRKAENDDNATAFLSSDDRFVPEPFEVGGFSAPDGKHTFLPDGVCDGFFAAKFKRIK